MIVTLDQSELMICNLVGRMRSLIARGCGVRDAKVGPQDGAEADITGVMAEFAFAKRYNVFPDIGLSPRSGSADGMLAGKRYDIKATKHKNGRLLCTTKKNNDVDIYVLAIVDGAEINFVGYATAEQLCREENLIDLGHGTGYGLTQEKLQKLKG
jgi:hypothetical protein